MGYFRPTPAQQPRDRLLAAVDAQFPVETSQVHMHRAARHPEALVNFLVTQVSYQATSNLLLTATQAGKPDCCRRDRLVESIHHCLLSLAAQYRPPARNGANRAGKLPGGERFEDVAGGA